ncbi:hypothetical protein R1flu_026050 [Riccia fluitans]|uniref:Uncharacterized protein n=1 Tax=Riccia fluitans TaxID=41844 RepID=A0ABD1XEV0_9MARC
MTSPSTLPQSGHVGESVPNTLMARKGHSPKPSDCGEIATWTLHPMRLQPKTDTWPRRLSLPSADMRPQGLDFPRKGVNVRTEGFQRLSSA